MSFRPAISAPLPWLTMLIGRLYPGSRAGTASARGRAYLRLPRSLSITREGKIFIAILFLVGLAAINTGNNLLYLVLATLLSFIIISGLMSESTLRGVSIRRVFPAHVYKGVPTAVRLRVKNGKRFLPSISFSLREADSPGASSSSAYVLKLGAGAVDTVVANYTFGRRGRYRLGAVRVSTRFPFGIFLKGKEDVTHDEVVVYPAVRPAGADVTEGGGRMSEGSEHPVRGSGTQLYNLRQYTPNDDARFIYWRSAAKSRRLLVKEFEEEREKKVYLFFDNVASPDGDDYFEKKVDEAAGIVAHLIDRGYAVGMRTLSSDLPPESGKAQFHRLLTALALIGPAGRGDGGPRLRVVYL